MAAEDHDSREAGANLAPALVPAAPFELPDSANNPQAPGEPSHPTESREKSTGDPQFFLFLDPLEVRARINQLGHDRDALNKLVRVAKYQAAKCRCDPQELLNESIRRILSRTRAWPSQLPTDVFVGGVIRGVANQWYKKRLSLRNIDKKLDESTKILNTQEYDQFLVQNLLKDAMNQLSDRPIAQKVFAALIEDISGPDIQESLQLTRIQFDTAVRFIRRRLDKYLRSM